MPKRGLAARSEAPRTQPSRRPVNAEIENRNWFAQVRGLTRTSNWFPPHGGEEQGRPEQLSRNSTIRGAEFTLNQHITTCRGDKDEPSFSRIFLTLTTSAHALNASWRVSKRNRVANAPSFPQTFQHHGRGKIPRIGGKKCQGSGRKVKRRGRCAREIEIRAINRRFCRELLCRR
jgi:hypothetical protein